MKASGLVLDMDQDLSKINNIEIEIAACELLIPEFPDNPRLTLPHLRSVWSEIESLDASEIAEGVPKSKQVFDAISDLKKDYAEFTGKLDSEDSHKISRNIERHLQKLLPLVVAIKIELLKKSGWKPWYRRSWFIRTMLAIAVMLTCLYFYSRHQQTKYGYKLVSARQQWGTLAHDKSVSGKPLRISGKTCKWGFGTHAVSKIEVMPLGNKSVIEGTCGLDDGRASKNGSVQCEIMQQGKSLFKTDILKGDHVSEKFSIKIEPNSLITLNINNAGDNIDYDHADWCELIVK